MHHATTPRIHGRYLKSFCLLLLASTLLMTGCSSPAEKAERYYKNGMALLEKGELDKARIELQNSLQIVNTNSEAVYGLALIAERQGDWERMFGLLRRVIDLNPGHMQAHVSIGRLLLASGDLDGAMNNCDIAIKLAPNDPVPLSLRAAILYKRGQKSDAVAQANAVIANSPANVDALAVLATDRLSAGDKKGAIAYIDAGLAGDPRNVPLHLFKIQIHEFNGELAAAETVYRRMIENAEPSQRTGLRQAMAQFYLRHKNQDKAEAELRSIISDNPNDLDAKLTLASMLRATRGNAVAAAELQAMANRDPSNYRLRFALADLYRQMNDLPSMQNVLREIAGSAENKDALKAKSLLAGSLLSSGDRAGASALVTEVLGSDPKQEDAVLLKASMEIDDRKIEPAIADLRTVLKDAPDNPRAHLLLGRAHELSGATALANDEYLRAYEGSRKTEMYGVAYSEFLLRRGNGGRAREVTEEMLQAAPERVPLLQLLAKVRISQGDWAGAQEVADRIAKGGANKPVADQIRGVIFAQTRNFDASVKAFKSAHDAAPEDNRALAALVRSYAAGGKLKEAVALLDSTLASAPKNVIAMELKAQMQLLQKDSAGARQTLERAIAVVPQNDEPYRNLAMLHLQERRPDEAQSVINRGLKALPDNMNLQMTLAGIHESTGQADSAIAIYERMLGQHPDTDVIVNNLASLLAENRDDPKSIGRAYELAQKIQQSDIPQMKDTVGWASYRAGHYPQAVAALEQAAQQLPDAAVVRYHLGLAYKAQGKKQEARAQLERAVKLAEAAPFAELEKARAALTDL